MVIVDWTTTYPALRSLLCTTSHLRWTGLCGLGPMAKKGFFPAARLAHITSRTCRGFHGPFRVPVGNTSPLPYPNRVGSGTAQKPG